MKGNEDEKDYLVFLMMTAPATAREAMSARAMKPLSEVGSVPPLDSSAGFDSGLDSPAGAEESSATSEELSEQAYTLNNLVGKFTLRRD